MVLPAVIPMKPLIPPPALQKHIIQNAFGRISGAMQVRISCPRNDMISSMKNRRLRAGFVSAP